MGEVHTYPHICIYIHTHLYGYRPTRLVVQLLMACLASLYFGQGFMAFSKAEIARHKPLAAKLPQSLTVRPVSRKGSLKTNP